MIRFQARRSRASTASISSWGAEAWPPSGRRPTSSRSANSPSNSCSPRWPGRPRQLAASSWESQGQRPGRPPEHHPDHRRPGRRRRARLFLVMELLTGVSLETAIRRQSPPMSVAEFVGVMVQVSRALAAAHKSGVIHRDLKPTNIFLHKDREGAAVPEAPRLRREQVPRRGGGDVAHDRRHGPRLAALHEPRASHGRPRRLADRRVRLRNFDHVPGAVRLSRLRPRQTSTRSYRS